ncbi:MAG: VCBS repeat-containing protein [Propionibacteriaceae bacterium]
MNRQSRVPAILTISGLAAAACLAWPAPVAYAAVTCSSTSASDLNGDGYDDAVVGDPYATVNGKAGAGVIVVLYGDQDGRIGEGKRAVYSQASVPGSNVESGDHFGWSVDLADVTDDGCADILVGSPDEDWDGHADAGIAHVISFTPDGKGGLGTPRARVLDQGDVDGTVEVGDQFGYAVALNDFYGGDEAFGAVSAPGEDLQGVSDAGVVNTFDYLEAPLHAQQRAQGQVAEAGSLPGRAEAGDRFGASLIITPLEVTDGHDWGVEPSFLAGAPGDTVMRGSTAIDNAGSITLWDPVTGYRRQLTQDSPGVAGAAEAGDQFGSSVAASETSSTGHRVVAVGAPREDVGRVVDAGSVTVFSDVKRAGLQGRAAVSQDTSGFDGTAESGDRFGQVVALRSGSATTVRLGVGAPYENVGSVKDSGMVGIADIALSTGAITSVGSYTENSAGTPGTVATSNRFGSTVTALQGQNESVLTISSPYQKAGSVVVVDAEDRTRSWVPGKGGVPSLTSGRFGWSVTGPSE